MDREDLINKTAELVVGVGVNLQPGQPLLVSCLVEHAELARAITRAAYSAGASYVDVGYNDQHVRRAMIEHAEDDILTWTPPYRLAQLRDLAADKGAYIAILGDPEPDLMADLDPARVGGARMLDLSEENVKQLSNRATSWAIVGMPNEGWARAVFGEPDVDRLWDAVARATRLYEDDPVEKWRAHMDRLERRAAAMNERRFDSLHYTGPGTDLRVGLLPGSRWKTAQFETSWGQRFVANLPTEEVFTSPDYRRTEGVVASTKPLHMTGEGVTVRDLVVRFEGGRIIDVTATAGADVIKAQLAIDDQASYLGEVALVDRDSAVGETGITFANTLFDENAAAHIAYGAGFPMCVDGAEGLEPERHLEMGLNHSKIHTDFMIGGPEVTIEGVTAEGDRVPIIQNDIWQLPL